MDANSISLMLLLVVLGSLVQGFETNYGIPGVPGCHGIPGITGKDGRDGIKGAKGEPGVPGLALTQGEDGDKGDPGITGPTGKRGRRGSAGEKGDPGNPGIKGEMGRSGDHKSTLKSAFSAKRGGHEYPPRDTRIRFSKVISNDQNHYDSDTGVFTCNITGFYYFVYYATSNNNLCVSLIAKGIKKAGFCNHGNIDQVSSGGIVLHLQVNDEVWLEPTDYNAMMGKEDHDSVFSGFLLFPD
ncbi:complement C1q subcomponent subunit C-like [Heterodontus francisci]|uniref:complement C1q subcomponent subunit C-like n=1 Tax=Heterodontus francisci TaxID=7792 RepID=UPI00355C5E01